MDQSITPKQNTDDSSDIRNLSLRMDSIEAALRQLGAQLEELKQAVEQDGFVRVMNPPIDSIRSQFSRLESFIIHKFPQYAHITEAGVDIPGVTGGEEMGPGNKPMPRTYAGGNVIRDPYKRVIR